jgi:hypothetical protein
MRAFVIEAKSLESAQALYNALSEFHADLSASDGDGYRVTVELGSNDHGVLAVLDTVQEFVSARNDGPARLELGGRQYTVHPAR